MRVERGGAGDQDGNEDVQRKHEAGNARDERHRQQEVRRVVALRIQVMRRNQVMLRVMGVVKVDVVAEQHATPAAMAELVVQHCLRE